MSWSTTTTLTIVLFSTVFHFDVTKGASFNDLLNSLNITSMLRSSQHVLSIQQGVLQTNQGGIIQSTSKPESTPTPLCLQGSKVNVREYSGVFHNYTLVGPVFSTITTRDLRECELECHLAVPDVCGMFNYCLTNNSCELLYKDRAPEYTVQMKNGTMYKTRKAIRLIP